MKTEQQKPFDLYAALMANQHGTAIGTGHKLIRRKPGMMALEQRFMFDGAAAGDIVSEAIKTVQDGSAPDLLQFAVAESALPPNVLTAQAEAERLITEFLAGPATRDQLFTLFSGGQTDGPSAAWLEAYDQLMASVRNDAFAVRVELRSSVELQGAKGAFSANGTSGQPTIYLNSDWLAGGGMGSEVAGADSASITRVLVEELGHSLDARLNGHADTAGDEGEIFSRVLVDGENPLSVSFLSEQNDHTTLHLDGQSVQAEMAAFSFVGAYAMVYDLNNSNTVVGSTGETAAEKEQSTHNFNTTSLGAASINDNSNSNLFSGNDVSAIGINIGGTTYYGWVSRPIKAGGIVRGFYFWTDNQFNTSSDPLVNLATAQADGNQDADGSADNKGFLLVVDQAWFNTQIAARNTNVTLNNTVDGNLGVVNYATVGSSSDRVDTALNSLMTPNAVIANADSLSMAEDSTSSSGNLLSNDSDPNSDTFTLTSYTIDGLTGNQALGTDITIAGKGTINIAANGNYTFTPAANYFGPVPVITYTITDRWGATSSSTFSINVTSVNDAPVATNDSLNATEDVPRVITSADLFGTDGTGTSNDNDVDSPAFASITITALPSSGSLYLNGVAISATGTTVTAAQLAAGLLEFRPTTNFNGTSTFKYTVSDGSLSSNEATVTLNVAAVNDQPAARDDTGAVNENATLTVSAANGVISSLVNNPSGYDNDPDGTTPFVTGVTTGLAVSVAGVGAANVDSTNNSGVSLVGVYGTLKMNADGSYIYVADQPAANALAGGVVANDVFTYAISDGNGGTAFAKLTIAVTGVNDAPIARDDYNTVTEAATQTAASSSNPAHYGVATGTITVAGVLLNDSDVDNTFSITQIATADTVTTSIDFGGDANSIKSKASQVTLVEFVSDPTGTVTWSTLKTLQNTNVLVSSFTGSGQTLSVVLTDPTAITRAIATYYSGVTNPTFEIRVTIGSSTYTGTYTGSTTTPGVTSPLSGETPSVGRYGTLFISPDGSYRYYLTSNALAIGETYTENFSYTITDTQGATASAVLHVLLNGTSTISMTSESVSVGEDAGAITDVNDGLTGNLLSNDTGFSGNPQITTYVWDGIVRTVGTVYDNAYGTLKVDALGTYSFTPAANYSGTVPGIRYTVSDGTLTGEAVLNIIVTPASDAPSLDLDGNGSTNTAATAAGVTLGSADYFTVFTENGSGVSIGDSDTTIADVDSSTLSSATIVLTNAKAGDLLTVGALPSGVTATVNTSTPGQITVTISGSATKAAYQNFIRSVTFSNTSEDPDSTLRIVESVVNDGSASSAIARTYIQVQPVNDAPVIDLDGSAAGYDWNSTYTNGASGVGIADIDSAVTDPDHVNMTSASVMLTNAQAGDLLSLGSLPFGISGSINTSVTGQITVTLTGNATKADYEAAIEGLRFSSTGYSQTDRIFAIKVNDGVADSNTATATLAVAADNRPVTVMGSVVNEASPYLMFEVSGAQNQWVSLNLGVTGTGNGHAETGKDFMPNLQYFDGAQWQAYTSGLVQITDAGGKLRVRTAVIQDSLFESSLTSYETLLLTARNAAGTANALTGPADTLAEGMAQIRDDGAGDIFLGNSNTFLPNVPGDTDPAGPDFPAKLDDDRPVTVSDIEVNEGSPYAVFTVTGAVGQWVQLNLTNGTAGSLDHGTALEFWNGTTWQSYSANAYVQIDSTGILLVRTTIQQDGTYEGVESFFLTASNTGSGSALGTALILDDGNGNTWNFGDPVNQRTPTVATGPGAGFDDDRALTISDISVNEGSPYAVFTVSGAANQLASLALAAGTTNPATADGTDYGLAASGSDLQYWNGAAWTDYSTASYVALNANGKLLVRVAITNDTTPDNGETFKLNATNTGGTSGTGVATIKDDGTGTLFTDANPTGDTPPTDSTSALNDDRPLSVTSPRVNEGSSFAVFTVTGGANQRVSLALVDGSATGADYGPALEIWNGVIWVAYVPGNLVSLDANGRLLVRTPIANDTIDEGEHQFSLVASNTGGGSANGTATIDDHGAGDIFMSDGTVDPTAIKNDDRPISVTVAPPPVSEPDAPPPPVFPAGEFVPPPPAKFFVPEPVQVREVLTSSSGFRAAVIEGSAPALTLFKGIDDQFVESVGGVTSFALPSDAFAHTRADASLTLEAKMADGTTLPAWVAFDGQAGVFRLTPPEGFTGQLEVKVIARDNEGREAEAKFKLTVSPKVQKIGRESLSEKLKLAGRQPVQWLSSHEIRSERWERSDPASSHRATSMGSRMTKV